MLLVPLSEIFVTLVNRLVSKFVKPKILPRVDEIDKGINTFVIVPTLLNSAERVKEIMSRIEVYYLGNKMDRLFFLSARRCFRGKK